MAEPAQVFSQPHDVTSRLAVMGVQEANLHKAVQRGVIERMACTRFDPPSYPGVVQWARTVRDLRESFVPLGWRADDSGNFSTVVSPDDRVAISVSTGDDRTGKEGLPMPSTKYPKGAVVMAAINRNIQLSLLHPFEALPETPGLPDRRATWMLLMLTQRKDKEVRFELSLPNEIGDDNRVRSWSERIILPAIDLDIELPGDDDPPIQGIDVPVDRI